MDNDDGDSLLRGLLPTSFGKQSTRVKLTDRIENFKRGRDTTGETATVATTIESQVNEAKRPLQKSHNEDSIKHTKPVQSDSSTNGTAVNVDSDLDSDADDNAEDELEPEFPVSHEIVIKSHERAVTCLTLDYLGARMISGSLDCTLKFHDFAAMTPTTIRAFRTVDPCTTKSTVNSDQRPVYQVAFNPVSSDTVLVIPASLQARVFDREGEQISEYVKGDMYLHDLNNTKGHVAELTSGCWHPWERDYFVTAAIDSTIRIWDVNVRLHQKQVIKFKSTVPGSGGRSRMTTVAWGPTAEGNKTIVASSALDGTLVLYNGEGPFYRPMAEVRKAHEPGTWTSGLAMSPDGRLIVTRGGDNTIKLWDSRKLKQPVNQAKHTSTSETFPTSNIIFSRNGGHILTGSETGDLYILNSALLKPECVEKVTPGSPLITVQWHSQLNQILTGSANGETHVLFNPKISKGGACTVMSKAPKKRYIDDDPSNVMDLTQGFGCDNILTPGGILGEGNPSTLRYARKLALTGSSGAEKPRDPRRPHIPLTTPFAHSQPDDKHIREQIPLSCMRDEDPREALLKYAEKAEQDPMFTLAWKKTQPKPVFSEYSDEEDDQQPKVKRARPGL